jgi:hypothetical protein
MNKYGLKNNAAEVTFNLCSSKEILSKVETESLGADKVELFHSLALAGRNSLFISSWILLFCCA